MKPLNLFPAGAILAPLFLAVLENHAHAQAPAAETVPAAIAHDLSWTNVLYDEPGDGHLWAVGAAWKASFGADGVVYYPRAGASEPRKLPHALSPDLVTIGGEPIAFECAALAVRNGDRVEFHRGGFIERYDLAPAAVEQSFVFDALPQAGDLVLRIPIASDLSAVETDAGLEFRSDRGRLEYSRAIAVDASGRRTETATHIEAGAITIRVAADVLADARFPLVIDPVLNTIYPEGSGPDAFSADAAYDPFNQVWVVVYEHAFSASDHDIIAKMYDATGSFIAQASVDATTDSWIRPRIADLASAHKFLVVGGSTAASGGAKTVRGRIVQPNGTLLTLDPQISVSGATSGDCIVPDVGGDPSIIGAWCVVFERDQTSSDHTVCYRLVFSNGGTGVGPLTMPPVAGSPDGNPSISRSNGGSPWLVTWERAFSLAASIQGARISPAAALLTPPFTIASGTLLFDPRASSPIAGTDLAAVVYQGGIAFGSQDSTIVVALLDAGTVLQLSNLMTLESSTTAGEDQIEPSVDSDGSHFLVSYSEFDSPTARYNVFVADLAVSANALQIAQKHLALPGALDSSTRSSVAAARTTGALAHRYLTVFDYLFTFGPLPSDHDVQGTFVDGLSGGPSSTFCFGDGTGTACPCGNSGSVGHGCANSAFAGGASLQLFSGEASTVADTAMLQVANAPAGGTGLFFQGTTAGAGAVFGDGLLCAGGTIVRLLVKTANPAGVVFYPQAGDAALSVAGAVPVAGGLRTYQFWYRDAVSFCTGAVFNLSNGLAVQWAR